MDGGGRLLQSLRTIGLRRKAVKASDDLHVSGEADLRLKVGTDAGPSHKKALPKKLPSSSRRLRSQPLNRWQRASKNITRRGAGVGMALSLVLAVGIYGGIKGGGIERFLAENGAVRDIMARGLGFGIEAITITGQRELISTEVLALAGIRPQDSLLFLDAEAIRARLVVSPMIKTADIRKLYPNQLIIAIHERKADAVWQVDGEVSIIAADGRVIDKMRDQRYARLPFIVGEGAQKRYGEYMKILAASGSLRTQIRAGTLVGERRWTIKFSNGLDLKLPERQPDRAMAQFASLAKTHDLMEKDLIVADMRAPGRFSAQLSAEALAKRMDGKPKTVKRKGGAA